MDLNNQKIAGWLGLTSQQFDILQCIHFLQLEDRVASPKNIQAEFKRRNKKHLQKPNLFNIIKILRQKKLIKKSGFGEYVIEFEGIKKALADHEGRLTDELDKFQTISKKTEEYFSSAAREFERPHVSYLEPHQFSERINKALQKASVYYSTTSFPNISFNPEVAYAIKRPEYVKILWERGIIKKKLKINYLTDMNVEYLFNYVSKAYNEPETAYKICLDSINQLNTHIDTHDNLEIMYQETPLYLDIHMPIIRSPKEFYSHMRGLRSEILGVIYVRSRDSAEATKKLFQEVSGRGTLLKEKTKDKIIKKTREKLKQHHKTIK